MNISHFHGNNLEVAIFRGLCEIIEDHYHPALLSIIIDQQTEKMWMIIEILENKSEDPHNHTIVLQEGDINCFLNEKQFTVFTFDNDNEIGHQHKIYFSAEHQQQEVIDIFTSQD